MLPIYWKYKGTLKNLGVPQTALGQLTMINCLGDRRFPRLLGFGAGRHTSRRKG